MSIWMCMSLKSSIVRKLFCLLFAFKWILSRKSIFLYVNGFTLSNSNPTWNSTELELVRVGVDFVFQCHNKNKNKNKNNKNPHLILIYRKVLQVYNLGRVTVWVSRSCLEGVWKVSGKCLKVSGKCLEGVWKVS